ncbi:unnamed protein product [Triticum turgidum subsp. durum]|nr:unnamed protein product [Triticum turgidum subsp. durum]
MAEAAGSSTAATAVTVALFIVVLVVALLLRQSLRRAAERREEVRRLARLAAEESELAERESVLAFCSELFPGVLHAADVPEAPMWAPREVVSPQEEEEEVVEAPAPPQAAAGVCAVCFRPTTFRCKQCKAVKYCSFKCQISHWRKGHKDECHPPSANAKPDDGAAISVAKEGNVEHRRASEENVVAGVQPVAEISVPVASESETSGTNHVVKSSNDKRKDTPFEEVSATTEIPEKGNSDNVVKLGQITPQVTSFDSKRAESNTKSTNFVGNSSYVKDLDDILVHKSQASAPKMSGLTSSIHEDIYVHCKDHGNTEDADVSKDCSRINHIRKPADRSYSQMAATAVPAPKSSRTSLRVEVEPCKIKATGEEKSEGLKLVTPVLAVDKVSSIHGGRSVAPNPSKRADNPTDRGGSAANNLATSLKKIVRQQTTPKVVRHYPSELTLFPYDVFIKLYDKVELRPFGLHNLGNSCYANVVLQCLMFTRPLTTYLLGGLHSKNCSKKAWCFMCEFERLIVEGKQGKTALSPTGILSHLHEIGSSFGPGKQEDAHEFLRHSIDAMQSVCIKEARKGGAHCLAEETTLVQLIFGGYLRSKIKCTRCHISSEQYERMLDLTVEIDGDISSLEEALQRFTSTEVLDGDNRYQCSRCNSYERAKKKLTISEAPNVLTIALKRYQSGKFGKISKAIRFPETLNLSCYMNSTDDNSPVYSLYGMVVHHDVMNAAFSGHYVCYVKDTHGKWYKIDDSQVKPVSLENVMSKCAYMLLYARCSPRAPNSVRHAMMVNDPSYAKKARHKPNLEQAPLQRGSLNRHQGDELHRDHITDNLTRRFDEFGDAPYPAAESPSPSESSSLFSNSDAGSHSTVSTDSSESTRNSTSTDDYEQYFFGSSDQMYQGGPRGAHEEIGYTSYYRSRSALGTSSSGQEVDEERSVEQRFEVSGSSPLSYTDQSKQHLLTEQYRQFGGSEHDPGEARGSVLLRRSAREKTAQTFY